MPDGLTLINRTIKSFEDDFAAVGDDVTDNAPSIALAMRWMAGGGNVEAGPGLFRYSDWPAFSFRSGGFHGAGPGGELYAYASGAKGTILRHIGTGHGLSFVSGARDMEFTGFALHPVYRKSGDNAEIFLGDRATNIAFRKLKIAYPNVAVRQEAGVHNLMQEVIVFAPHGSSGWYATGIAGGNRNEGLTLVDCESYTPHKRSPMPEAATFKPYATTSAFNQSDYSIVSGWLMECYTAGTKGASAPSIPAMTYAHEHTTVFVNDGSIVWGLVCKADYAAVDADSWGDYVTVVRGRMLEGINAVRMKNMRSGASSASRPKKMVIDGMQNDHNAGHACNIVECGSFALKNSEIESARGAAVYFGSGTAKRRAIGNEFQSCDQGGIVTEAAWPWTLNDMIASNTPNDGVIARAENGSIRFDCTYALNLIANRRISGTEYQWHLGVQDDGDCEVRQDLPNGNVAQTWLKV